MATRNSSRETIHTLRFGKVQNGDLHRFASIAHQFDGVPPGCPPEVARSVYALVDSGDVGICRFVLDVADWRSAHATTFKPTGQIATNDDWPSLCFSDDAKSLVVTRRPSDSGQCSLAFLDPVSLEANRAPVPLTAFGFLDAHYLNLLAIGRGLLCIQSSLRDPSPYAIDNPVALFDPSTGRVLDAINGGRSRSFFPVASTPEGYLVTAVSEGIGVVGVRGHGDAARFDLLASVETGDVSMIDVGPGPASVPGSFYVLVLADVWEYSRQSIRRFLCRPGETRPSQRLTLDATFECQGVNFDAHLQSICGGRAGQVLACIQDEGDGCWAWREPGATTDIVGRKSRHGGWVARALPGEDLFVMGGGKIVTLAGR